MTFLSHKEQKEVDTVLATYESAGRRAALSDLCAALIGKAYRYIATAAELNDTDAAMTEMERMCEQLDCLCSVGGR